MEKPPGGMVVRRHQLPKASIYRDMPTWAVFDHRSSSASTPSVRRGSTCTTACVATAAS